MISMVFMFQLSSTGIGNVKNMKSLKALGCGSGAVHLHDLHGLHVSAVVGKIGNVKSMRPVTFQTWSHAWIGHPLTKLLTPFIRTVTLKLMSSPCRRLSIRK